MSEYHVPVMMREVVDFLRPSEDGIFVDVTLGGGGHAFEIASRLSSRGTFIGIDRDGEAIAEGKKKLGSLKVKKFFINGAMSSVSDHLEEIGIKNVDGILADLGVSSHQLDDAKRGFSFLKDAELDMRMDKTGVPSAAELLESLEEEELSSILKELGEERFARRIASNIKKFGKVSRTGELADIVVRSYPPAMRRSRIHPATRTFQALRIAVNGELDELKKFMSSAPALLRSGGRLVIISYHSLEDRIVKHSFRELVSGKSFSLPVRRVVVPSKDEVEQNPRSRSAKLRVIEKG
ncbi:MAG TPA: 16S rRNA (cytosine(1402)-N(4))-methyltransferase RsmH [bacterium]|nr:16S rRNA (cytosine(1402)-N(4))-methyltransferase RsmH [Myxococcales bacterium]OQA59284.1 MAG: Ribosomal RNA small subunit methyltransferase H [bacterium ADurb.Bin270]HPW45176.1 16S rRNA (cytosine(1402)-N(4))-methyltransferase RsmH [bacterium]HQC50680.1 16S rRNA (cytosine(1402)-N(4))-methyltransferase RsmH [bacterium]HQG12931.1 16S rRNA (cytosine(1402)-N(4))-methyltransferase RsmH [bacterium]